MTIFFIIEDFFLSDPELKEDIPSRYKSYKEIYEVTVKKGCHILNKIRTLRKSGDHDIEAYTR